MRLHKLTEEQRAVIYDCMNTVLKAPFIEDPEFQTRLGIGRKQLKAVIDRWPRLQDSSPDSEDSIAINNCLNELAYGIPMTDAEWSNWLNSSRDEVRIVFHEWKNKR